MDLPNTTTIVIVAVILLVLGGLLVMGLRRAQRSKQLKERFGPEYERAVQDFGDRSKAENDLIQRQQRINKLNIRSLTPAERNQYREAWREVQARFVDDPQSALLDADRLVTEVLHVRGYPTEDFDERLADISAAYPRVTGSYRQACEMVSRLRREDLTTEDMRKAMVLYRDLFDELFGADTDQEYRRAS